MWADGGKKTGPGQMMTTGSGEAEEWETTSDHRHNGGEFRSQGEETGQLGQTSHRQARANAARLSRRGYLDGSEYGE